MAVDRFPVEFSHIMMFARSVGDDNPIYPTPTTPRPPRRLGDRPADLRPGRAQFDPDYPPAPQGRQAVVRLGQGRRPASEEAGGEAAATAAACTPSSTSNITVTSGPATC